MLSTHEYSHGWTRHGKWKWLFPDIYFFVHDRTHDCGTNHYRTHSRVLGLTAPRHSSIVRRMESSRRAHLKIGYDREEENVWKPSESTEKTTKRPRKTITLIINSGTCFFIGCCPPSSKNSIVVVRLFLRPQTVTSSTVTIYQDL
jgi:hypothetical protein